MFCMLQVSYPHLCQPSPHAPPLTTSTEMLAGKDVNPKDEKESGGCRFSMMTASSVKGKWVPMIIGKRYPFCIDIVWSALGMEGRLQSGAVFKELSQCNVNASSGNGTKSSSPKAGRQANLPRHSSIPRTVAVEFQKELLVKWHLYHHNKE